MMNGMERSSFIINLDSQIQKLRTFTLLVLLAVSSISYGHDYFFGFAEVEYNDITQEFEATLTVSTHDLENILLSDNVIEHKLDTEKMDAQELNAIEKYLLTYFSISTESRECKFKLIGYDVHNNGSANFYFESEAIELGTEIEFQFDLLMNQFQEQQNKITLYYRNKNYTFPFRYNQRKQTFKLENV